MSLKQAVCQLEEELKIVKAEADEWEKTCEKLTTKLLAANFDVIRLERERDLWKDAHNQMLRKAMEQGRAGMERPADSLGRVRCRVHKGFVEDCCEA